MVTSTNYEFLHNAIFCSFLLVGSITKARITCLQIIFVVGVAFYQTQYKVLMRKTETGKNAQRVNFSNPFRLFLCATTEILQRFHQDDGEMRVVNAVSKTKMKKEELCEGKVREGTEI